MIAKWCIFLNSACKTIMCLNMYLKVSEKNNSILFAASLFALRSTSKYTNTRERSNGHRRYYLGFYFLSILTSMFGNQKKLNLLLMYKTFCGNTKSARQAHQLAVIQTFIFVGFKDVFWLGWLGNNTHFYHSAHEILWSLPHMPFPCQILHWDVL